MGKKLKYKAFSKFNSIIGVNVVAIVLLGISYGYWSNILTVNVGVTTGELNVEGIIDEIESLPIRVEIVKLEQDQSTLGYYKGSADIIFSVENTGDTAALISLNKNVIGGLDKNTWIKFMNGDTVLSECLMPVESKTFNVSIIGQGSTIISENLWDVEEFLLSPGEQATVTLKECEFEVAVGEDLWQLEMETQVSLAYKDQTGAWYGDTSNSLYIRQRLSELYDITTVDSPSDEVDIPVTLASDEADIPVNLPSDEVDIPVNLPLDEVDIPVNLPSDEVDIPVALPSDEADIPVTLPSDEEDVITEEDSGADTPVILPSDPVIEEEAKGIIPIE